MNRFPILALCLAIVGLLSSCVRTSTVVEVDPNGAGEVIARYYFSPQVTAMLAMMEQNAAGGAPQAGMPDFGLLKSILSPEEASLKEDAKNYGEGVEFARLEKGKDSDGWDGYTVAYRFEDISKVKIDQNSMPGKAKEFVESTGQSLDDRASGTLSFEMNDKVLTIHTSLASGNVEEMIDEEQLAQAKQMGMKPSEAMKMASASMQGMRAGFFVRINGEIAETNAEHVTGNLIILSEADISEVMKDPDFAAFVDKVAEDPKVVTNDSVRDVFKNIEAMTLEFSETVTVKIK